MTDFSELVLLSGPPFTGKTDYYKRHFQETHERLCPSEIFEEDPSLGLRSIILKAVELLQQGKNVVIDDENRSRESRSSYMRVVQKKVPKCKFTIVKFAPKHGLQQLCWTREFRVASLAEKSCHQTLQVVGSKRTDSLIKKWFDEDDAIIVQPNCGYALDNESWVTIERNVGLTAETCYKMELPALFIQWEAVSEDMGSSPGEMAEVCTDWYAVNPCGRILFIADGSNIKTGVISSAQEKAQLIKYMTELIRQVDFPVYTLHVENPSMAVRYLNPPSPGLIAYLHRRHSIDLINKATIYLHYSQAHKDMAEKSGIQHLKVSKALQTPTLVKNNFVTVKCRQPSFLCDMDTRDPGETLLTGVRPDACIPLWQEFISYGLVDHQVSHDIGNGRREYLFVKDERILTQYNGKYQKNATPIVKAGSKIARLRQMSGASPEGPSPQTPSPSLKHTGGRSRRKTPSWMSQNLKTQASVSSEEGGTVPRVRKRPSQKTMYVMTEAELVDIATRILKEAGKPTVFEPELTHPEESIVHGETSDQSEADIPDETAHNLETGPPLKDTPENIYLGDAEPPVPSQTVGDVLDDLFSGNKKSVGKKRKTRSRIDSDDGNVADTVNLIPETAPSAHPAPLTRERTAPDLSVLDEIFS